MFLGRSVTQTRNVSEETLQKVDLEIRRIIDEQYAVSTKILKRQCRQGRGHDGCADGIRNHRC